MFQRFLETYTHFTVQPTVASDPHLKTIETALTRLEEKEKALAANAAKDSTQIISRSKHLILKKLLHNLNQCLEQYKAPGTPNIVQDKYLLAQRLQRIINLSITPDELKILLAKRNNNQYYANAAASVGFFAVGFGTNVVFPTTFAAILFNYYASLELVTAYMINSWEQYIPASVSLILELTRSLSKIEIMLSKELAPTEAPANHYTTLGIEKTATTDEIKKAFRTLARLHHPDHQGNAELFVEINRAKEILTDPEKRKEYDATLEKATTPSYR